MRGGFGHRLLAPAAEHVLPPELLGIADLLRPLQLHLLARGAPAPADLAIVVRPEPRRHDAGVGPVRGAALTSALSLAGQAPCRSQRRHDAAHTGRLE